MNNFAWFTFVIISNVYIWSSAYRIGRNHRLRTLIYESELREARLDELEDESTRREIRYLKTLNELCNLQARAKDLENKYPDEA